MQRIRRFLYRFERCAISACGDTARAFLGVTLATWFVILCLPVASAQEALRQASQQVVESITHLPQKIVPPRKFTPAPTPSISLSPLPGLTERLPEYSFAPYGSLPYAEEVIPAVGNADAENSNAITQTQFFNFSSLSPVTSTSPLSPLSPTTSGSRNGLPSSLRRVRINSRSDQPMDIISDVDPVTGRSVVLVSNGVNIVIEGLSESQLLVGGVVDIAADRAAIWATQLDSLRRNTDQVQSNQNEMECYVEGNIVFRDGTRTIFADQMYYDAKNKIGYIRNGEMLMPLGENTLQLQGVARLRAETLRQQGEGVFSASNTMMTTSLLGVPGYSLRSRNLTIKETLARVTQANGLPQIDPRTGNAVTQACPWTIAENNFIYLREYPVFYWPWMASSLDEPTLYIKNFFYGHDSTFGHQVRTTWNPYQLFNIRNRPEGCTWDINLDYLSLRGFGAGTGFTYDRSQCLGLSGQTRGSFDFWGIYDTGHDNLGRERRNVSFPNPYRYQTMWKHRQKLGTGNDPWIITSRVGKTSDRNFLKQYYATPWLTEENRTTSIELKKTKDSHSLSLATEYALDETVTNTNWLPRGDFYVLGRSFLHDRLTYYSHLRAGLANYKTTTRPTDATDDALFSYLDWETTPTGNALNVTTGVLSMRHEIDFPLALGPLKIVPFVLGDYSYYGDTRTGQTTDRAYGQGGVRFNLPLVKINPTASNRLWYVNGLAHKVDLDAEVSHADSNRRFNDLIVYDALDDWSTDDARRRFGASPDIYDPRYYAIRSGILNQVSSPMDMVDSLTLVRLGMTQRWQTKRGPVARRNIIDWITLSTHLNLYPTEKQNFGEKLGFIDYNLTWHVGDRFSILSSGIFDTFAGGQQIIRLGGFAQKPGRSSLYLGVDQFTGAFDRTYLSLALQYSFSKKYAMTYSTSYDLQNARSVGQNFKFSRSGESFRLIAGVVYNESRNDWGFNFSLEPVFLYGLGSNLLGR